MKNKRLILLVCTAFLLALMMAGCASKKSAEYQRSGFLSDYSMLTDDPEGTDADIYLKPGVDFSKYNRVLIDRVKVFIKDDADYKGIDPTELKALTDYFHEAFVRELGDAYPVVTEPGPDVLRLRLAITELVPTKPEMSVVTLVVPYATVADLAAGGASGKSPYLGYAAIEGELIDSVSNEQLGAYVERKLAKKYNVTGGAKKYVDSYVGSYSTWAYVKDAFDYWAKKLRMRMDEWHGIKKEEKE